MKTSLRESGIRFGSNLTARSSGTHPTYLRLIRFRIAPAANISLLVPNAHGQPIKGFIWSKSNLSSAIVAIAIVSMTRYSIWYSFLLDFVLLMDNRKFEAWVISQNHWHWQPRLRSLLDGREERGNLAKMLGVRVSSLVKFVLGSDACARGLLSAKSHWVHSFVCCQPAPLQQTAAAVRASLMHGNLYKDSNQGTRILTSFIGKPKKMSHL